jgi:hypothetical protein
MCGGIVAVVDGVTITIESDFRPRVTNKAMHLSV